MANKARLKIKKRRMTASTPRPRGLGQPQKTIITNYRSKK